MVLRDTRDERGAQFEAAAIEDDAALRVTGHHTVKANEFFGDAITSYDWAYVIAPDRVGTLFTLLGQAGNNFAVLYLVSLPSQLPWGASRPTIKSRRCVQQLA